jgi:D-galacturonate reductase
MTTDNGGYASKNPLFMNYTPDDNASFVGQDGYGYRSFEAFVDACNAMNTHRQQKTLSTDSKKQGDFHGNIVDRRVALLSDTVGVTAILEAGRVSLDRGCIPVKIHWSNDHQTYTLQ